MATFLKRERDSHWYRSDGSACHEVPYADPKKGMRATTLRDAKKMNLYPSVTNILQMKAKPGLDVWKLEQAILSTMTLPKKEGESLEDFSARIDKDMNSEAAAAAAWGTAIHEQIEEFNRTGAFPGTGEILDFVEGYEVWYRQNVLEVIDVEASVISEHGYAGRVDIHCLLKDGRRAIVDIKSQRLKGKPKPVFYKEWAMQLAAYAAPLRPTNEMPPALISLAIPSDEPGPAFPYEWPDFDEALKAFHACHFLWCWDKGYHPKP